MPFQQRKLQMIYHKSGHKKGFTLIELLVVIAVLVILVSIIIGFSASVIQGQNAKKTAYQMAFFLKSQTTKSFSERKTYSLQIKYANRLITLQTTSGSAAINSLNLPSTFDYSRSDNTTTMWSGTVNDYGKFSIPNFGILIKSKSGKVLYKITSYSSYSIKTSDINVYRAKSNGTIQTTPLLKL